MNIFSKYPNKYFVETGTSSGGGVIKAVEAGFEDIRSIELSQALHAYCCDLFKNNNIRLFHGDSTVMLWEMIKNIPGRITFFLDGHPCGGLSEHNRSPEPELIKELEQISHHPVKNHTILIDDYKDYRSLDLEGIILRINPDYKFSFDTYTESLPGNMLVAQIPGK